MFFLFCILMAVTLWGARPCLKEGELSGYLSPDYTQEVKGFFILLVFFSHFNSYVTYISGLDMVYKQIVGSFGQCMVTMFLFYSGYGVMESIRSKGGDYIRGMPRSRILRTWFSFAVAVLLFTGLALVRRKPFSLAQFLLSLTGWESMGNSNWYIFVILCLYLVSYGVFRLPSMGETEKILLVTALTGLGIFILQHWQIKPVHWYDTALCYPLGMLYSRYRSSLEKLLTRSRLLWAGALAGSVLVCRFFFLRYSDLNSILLNLSFTGMTLLVTMKISSRNPLLRWCGKHLFPLFILQRIPMILLTDLGLDHISIPLCFVCCLAATLLMVRPFERACGWLWETFQKPVLKKE